MGNCGSSVDCKPCPGKDQCLTKITVNPDLAGIGVSSLPYRSQNETSQLAQGPSRLRLKRGFDLRSSLLGLCH